MTHRQKHFLKRFELVDGVSGETIPASAGTHTFFMQAPEHPFVFREKGTERPGPVGRR